MTQILSSLSSSSSAQMTVEFPNLFGGFQATYSRSFSLFGIDIYWYGILIAVGIVLAYIYAMRRMTRDFGIVKDRAFDVIFAATLGGFLCARIYYCVFRTLDPNSDTKYNFITTFTTIRDGGIAIYGGVIGAVLIGLLFCKIRKVNFFAMADVASLGFLIGQGIGRWGNFINQEAYGEFCSKDWIFGMTGTRIAEEVGTSAPVHPCFLYESVWCLLGFLLLHLYSKKLRSYDGELALLYVAWYGFERMFVEGLRTDSLYLGQVRISQVLAAVSFIIALFLFIVFKIMTRRSGKPLYVNSEASAALIEHDRLAEEQRIAAKKAKKANKDKTAPSVLGEEEQALEASESSDEPAENITEKNIENNAEISAENAPESEQEKAQSEPSENKPENGEENSSENGLAKPKDE